MFELKGKYEYYILYNIRRSAFGAASSFEMSEHGDEVFQSDSRQGEHPAPALSQDTPSQPNQPKQDLVDTFDLFKTYLDHKLHDLKSDIISEQENLSLKAKEQVNLKFKSEGPCKAGTKGRLRSRTAHIIRIWIRTSF
jgi:hypothetical protein